MFEITGIINRSVVITLFVFAMMLIVDYINVVTQGKIRGFLRGNKKHRQYLISSFLGATPGCLGAFMSVSFYVHGLISFGALAACMIATSGDEAFVMLTLFPGDTLLLFMILFLLGILSGWFIDRFTKKFNIKTCDECKLQEIHVEDRCDCFNLRNIGKTGFFSAKRFFMLGILMILLFLALFSIIGPREWNVEKIFLIILLLLVFFIVLISSEHYLEKHIIRHIIRKHLWRIFLWTFFALVFVELVLTQWNLHSYVTGNVLWILMLSAIVGVIPESGPHMVFVMMYANGLIPFSVLLTSSIVQDGHGMLPLLSYTIKDSVLIKIFNLVIGLGFGLLLYLVGL